VSSSTTARFAVLPAFKREVTEAHVVREKCCTAEVSDESLLARISSGRDQDALGTLFARYVGLVRAVGRRILRDDAEAEDLVQDVFLFFFRSSTLFDRTKSPARSWIVQNIYYRAINRRRYLWSRHHLFGNEGDPTVEVRIDQTDSKSSGKAIFEGALVQEILQTLTSDQFETIRLFFFESYTLSEISKKLRQPLGNVRHHYYRGLNKLRARLFPE